MATKSTTTKAQAPAAKAPRVRKTLTNEGGATVLTITPVKAPAKKAPAVVKAAPVIPTDPAEISRALKSAKGSLWMMTNKRSSEPDSAKLIAQEAKIAALQAAWEAVKPARATGGYDGPSWVVVLDPKTGKAKVLSASDGAAARQLRSEAPAGSVVSVTAKA